MGIDQVKVRAQINIGSVEVKTPYILSFTVNKARGQVGTFSARLKVSGSVLSSSLIASSVVIKAGEGSASNTIFTGIVKTVSIKPCWDDPTFVNMEVTGEDWLSLLRGKKFTRRVTADTASWASIDSVVRKGVRGGKFKAKFVGKVTPLNSDLFDDSAMTRTAPLADLHKIPIDNVPEPKTPLPTAAGSMPKSERGT